MYSSGRTFGWTPDEHGPGHHASQPHPQQPPQSSSLPQLSPFTPLGRPAPLPPPSHSSGQYNPHANAFNGQPYNAETDLSAVRAFVHSQSTRAQVGEPAHQTSARDGNNVRASPSQQLIAAAASASANVMPSSRPALEDYDDGEGDSEPDAEPGPTSGGDGNGTDNNSMPPPPAGAIYPTRDALLRGCNEHARQYGYAMSIKKSSASGAKTIIVCTREGKPMNNHHLTDDTRVRRGRVSKRSGCRMKVAGNRLRRPKADGSGEEEEVWRLRVIEAAHNHGPDEARLNPIHRKMKEEVKESIVRGLRRGQKIKRIYDDLLAQWPDLAATKQDVRNEVGRIRKAEVDLTPLEEDTDAIAAEAARRREAQHAARSAAQQPTESDKTSIAVLRVEKARLETELQRVLRDANNEGGAGGGGGGGAAAASSSSPAAAASVREENEELKRHVRRLERENERLKRESIANEVRVDELRNVVDRYMSAASSPAQQQQQQPAQQQQQAAHARASVGGPPGLARTGSGQQHQHQHQQQQPSPQQQQQQQQQQHQQAQQYPPQYNQPPPQPGSARRSTGPRVAGQSGGLSW